MSGRERGRTVNYLTQIWVAMRTWNTKDSGTDSPIALIIHEEPPSDSPRDSIHHTFSDTAYKDQEKGQANLYDFVPDPTPFKDSDLADSSIRIGIRGRDKWRPEHIAVWGVGPKRWQDREEGDIAVPLGIETGIQTVLSTSKGEGNLSIPIRRAYVGYGDMTIVRLLMVMRTNDYKHSGTDSPIQLRVEVPGGTQPFTTFLIHPRRSKIQVRRTSTLCQFLTRSPGTTSILAGP